MIERLTPPARLLRLLPLFLPPALTACASVPPPQPAVSVAADGCRAFKQLSWSVDDTTDTATNIRRHNAAYARLCGKQSQTGPAER